MTQKQGQQHHSNGMQKWKCKCPFQSLKFDCDTTYTRFVACFLM